MPSEKPALSFSTQPGALHVCRTVTLSHSPLHAWIEFIDCSNLRSPGLNQSPWNLIKISPATKLLSSWDMSPWAFLSLSPPPPTQWSMGFSLFRVVTCLSSRSPPPEAISPLGASCNYISVPRSPPEPLNPALQQADITSSLLIRALATAGLWAGPKLQV